MVDHSVTIYIFVRQEYDCTLDKLQMLVSLVDDLIDLKINKVIVTSLFVDAGKGPKGGARLKGRFGKISIFLFFLYVQSKWCMQDLCSFISSLIKYYLNVSHDTQNFNASFEKNSSCAISVLLTIWCIKVRAHFRRTAAHRIYLQKRAKLHKHSIMFVFYTNISI